MTKSSRPDRQPTKPDAESRINAEIVLKNYKTYLSRFEQKTPSEPWELNLQKQYREHLRGETPERYLHALRESTKNADLKKSLVVASLALDLIESINRSGMTKSYLTAWSAMKLAFDFSKSKGFIGEIFSAYLKKSTLETISTPFLGAPNNRVSLETWSTLSDMALEQLDSPAQNLAQKVLEKSLDRILHTGSTKQLPKYLAEHFINNITNFSQKAVEYFGRFLQTNPSENYKFIFQEIIKQSHELLNPAVPSDPVRGRQGLVLSMLNASATIERAYQEYSQEQKKIRERAALALSAQKKLQAEREKKSADREAIEQATGMKTLLERCKIDEIDLEDFKLYFSTFLSQGYYYQALNPRTWETVIDPSNANKFSLTELGDIYSTRVTALNGVKDAQPLQQELRTQWQKKEMEWQMVLNKHFTTHANSLVPITTTHFAPHEQDQQDDITTKIQRIEQLEYVCERQINFLPESVQTFIRTQLVQHLSNLKLSLHSRLEKFDRDKREHEREQADREALLDYIEKYAEAAMDYLVALISRGTGIDPSELKTNVSEGELRNLSSVITTDGGLRLTQRVEQALVQRIELLRGSGLFLEIGDSMDIAKTRVHAIPWETPHEIAHEVSKQTKAEEIIRTTLTTEVERIAKLFIGKSTDQTKKTIQYILDESVIDGLGFRFTQQYGSIQPFPESKQERCEMSIKGYLSYLDGIKLILERDIPDVLDQPEFTAVALLRTLAIGEELLKQGRSNNVENGILSQLESKLSNILSSQQSINEHNQYVTQPQADEVKKLCREGFIEAQLVELTAQKDSHET